MFSISSSPEHEEGTNFRAEAWTPARITPDHAAVHVSMTVFIDALCVLQHCEFEAEIEEAEEIGLTRHHR